MAKRKTKKTKTAPKKVVKRKKSTTKAKKPGKKSVKKSVPKKAAPKRKAAPSLKSPSNHNSHWETYRNLQKKVDEAWEKLQASVKKKAKPEILIREKNHLLLLLGECNYMARECMRLAAAHTKKKK